MDRFDQLSAFVRTVEKGSQAAAAPGLGITPAMVGRRVRALENRLGTRLLNRTTAAQSLTEAGAAFLPRAAALLDQLEEAERAAADREAEPRGVLRVNGPMVFGVRHLAAPMAAFRLRHPALRVELTLNDRVVDVVEEGYDLAVRIGRLPDSSLVSRRLAPCRMVLCAAPSYLARRGAPDRPEALRGHDCLHYSYSSDRGAWRLTGPDGTVEVRTEGVLSANNGDALLAAAVAGAGIAPHPTFIAGDALRDGRLVRVLPGWALPGLDVHAVYASALHLSPKVRRFVDFLAERLGDPPDWDAGLG